MFSTTILNNTVLLVSKKLHSHVNPNTIPKEHLVCLGFWPVVTEIALCGLFQYLADPLKWAAGRFCLVSAVCTI